MDNLPKSRAYKEATCMKSMIFSSAPRLGKSDLMNTLFFQLKVQFFLLRNSKILSHKDDLYPTLVKKP